MNMKNNLKDNVNFTTIYSLLIVYKTFTFEHIEFY